MQTKFKKIVICLVVAGVATNPLSLSASQLDSALDGMFSNVTGAGTAQTPDRTAFLGGGLSVRMPIQNVNLVTFDPPRLSAGCGGLDAFGGSFSFISAPKLVELFRKVAQNSVGLAFKAAIDAINPQLSKLMQEFQEKISQLNGVAKNSCMLASQLMEKTGATKAISDTVSGWSNSFFPALQGIFDDQSAGVEKVTENPSATATVAAPLTPMSGNGIWKALNNPNANGGNGLGALFTDPTSTSILGAAEAKYGNEILMSLTGYYVVKTDDRGVSPSGTQLGSGAEAKAKSIISIDELRRGGTLKKFVCAEKYIDDTNGGCLTVSTEDFSFVGMQGKVRDLLTNGVGGPDIVTAFSSQPPVPLNAQQNLLLKITKVPVLGLLQRVGNNQSAQMQVLDQIVPLVAEALLYEYMVAATKVLNMVNQNPTADIAPFIVERITDLEKATYEMSVKNQEWALRLNSIAQFTDNIRSGNTAVFYSLGGK